MRMEYRVTAVDDSEQDLAFISDLVRKWAESRGHTVRISCFPSAEAYLFARADGPEADILILDVEMAGMDGVTLARRIRKENAAVQIVFLTGYSDYIAEGYDVAALHYLLKPADAGKLAEVLDRASLALARNERVILAESGGGIVRIPVHAIRYAEVNGNYVTIHAAETLRVRMTLSSLEEQLDARFCRAGRWLILNLTEIARVRKKEAVLLDGTVIPLPRGAYEKVSRAIIGME